MRQDKFTKKGGLEKISLRIWKDDYDYLKLVFPDNYNAQIRRMIESWIDQDRSERNEPQN